MTQTPNRENNEISFRDIVLTIRDYAQEIRRNWLWLFVFIVPISGFLLYQAFTTKPKYQAHLTFLVNSNEGASLGIAAIAGKLGLEGLGGGGGNNLDKIVNLARSRRIVQMALFQKANLNGQTDFFANHLIRERELHKAWLKDTTGLVGFLFKHANIDQFNRTENKALLTLYGILAGEGGIYSCSFDKMSQFLSLDLNTTDEALSIDLLKALFAELSDFYIEKTVAKEAKTYKVLKEQADSIKRLAQTKESAAARFDDQQRGLIFSQDRLPSDRLKKEALIYNTMYAESQKNLAVAGFALESKAPYIQEIDTPIAPIKPIKKSKRNALIFGFIIGGILGSLFIMLRKKIKTSLEL
jgi:uncharacterized protein involved in exopolysaccharide biosynthesis